MKIIKLQSENIKRLKAVEITPDGAIVRITGRNAEGKTSVLDSIMYALTGERSIPSEPIRRGAKRANIRLEIGDLFVERRFTNKGTYLSVTGKEGAVRSPQKMLDTLVGRLSFDPLSFSRENPKRQAEILRELAGIDLSELQQKEQELMASRRIAANDGKRLVAQLNAMTPPREDLPDKLIDISNIMDDLSDANKKNARISGLQQTLSASKRIKTNKEAQLESLTQQLQKLKEQIDAIKSSIASSEKDISAEQSALENAGQPVDIQALTEKVSEAEKINTELRDAAKYHQIEESVARARDAYASFNRNIEENRDEQSRQITEASYPLDGLSVSVEGDVLFDGLPIGQASLAEQLRISTAVAMALNPSLRVLRITDGSLLDSQSMKIIEDLANNHDYQVWIEQVDETGEVGFYIEDGTVKAIDGKPTGD